MAEILGLPRGMRSIPEVAAEWNAWRDKVIMHRVLMRDRIELDYGARKTVLDMAAADPLYDFCLFGSVFEPRDREKLAKGWQPLVPYHFQADLIRWIEDVMQTTKNGRGDGVIEKARGMAGSWTCCAYAAHHWKYDDGFLAGFMSYKQELVDKTNMLDTLFVKIESYLGLDPRVPAERKMTIGGTELIVPIRSPKWMVPEGYDQKQHNMELTLAHPTKTNILSGYSTGERTGVGARQTVFFLDEAAKFPAFPMVWNSIAAVTDHRIALSSADLRFGSGFRDLAREARSAQSSGQPAPSFIRLHPDLHPDRDELWREETEARHSGLADGKESMAREFDLDYEAGQGNHIYPDAMKINPIALDFHNKPGEHLDFCIDPGLRDWNVFHLVKYDEGTGRYGLLASYANRGYPAEYYASLAMARPISGVYEYGEDEERIMEWFQKWGRDIRFWVGDPAGRQRGQNTGTSFYDEFREATFRLSDGQKAINIWSSDLSDFKRQGPRTEALRWMLQRFDVNNAVDTKRTLAALADHRYKAVREDREYTTLPLVPVRTWGHDHVTALEFYAAHRKYAASLEKAAEADKRAITIRYSMSGKPLNRKKDRGWARG